MAIGDRPRKCWESGNGKRSGLWTCWLVSMTWCDLQFSTKFCLLPQYFCLPDWFMAWLRNLETWCCFQAVLACVEPYRLNCRLCSICLSKTFALYFDFFLVFLSDYTSSFDLPDIIADLLTSRDLKICLGSVNVRLLVLAWDLGWGFLPI